ncbi:MAG TPA: DUF1214 domain-containing protein [Phenylobacterium sp.]|uniref:DUF1214 domain-containing protein n=1 Tax=Phenylobacterium sp. TaxID=1871053 RepID=UPI002F959D98
MPQTQSPVMTAAEIRQVAAELMVLGFPLVLTDMVRRAHPLGGNRFCRLPDHAGLLAPGLADDAPRTLITSAWLDISQGPATLRWPDDQARRLCVVLYDAWGRRIAPLAAPLPSARIAIVGADQVRESPDADAVWRLPSASAWMLTRIAPRSADDHAASLRLLMGPSIAAPKPWPDQGVATIEGPPRDLVEAALALAPAKFLHRLMALLARHPPSDPDTGEALGRLGCALGSAFPDPATAGQDEAVAWGFKDGADQITGAAHRRLSPAGPWDLLHAPHDDDDPLSRAVTAATSLGSPAVEDLACFRCDRDAAGQPLRGSEQYRLTFASPENAEWSLALRSSHPGYEVIADPGPDGVADFVIQHLAPTEDVANWLPSPPAEFNLLLRIHRPTASVLNGDWRPPQVTTLSRP